MNIVILDGKTTNPGDLSWKPLESLGSLCVYDTSTEEETIARAREAEAIILCRANITPELLRSLPKLKYIGTLATGYNTIDLKAADACGITVCNVPFYCIETVAQHVFALLLQFCNHINSYNDILHKKGWGYAVEQSAGPLALQELNGKKLGLLGFGNIAQAVAKIGEAFGMEILVNSRRKPLLPDSYQWRTLDALFTDSDVLSVHCPLTTETRGLIDRRLLSKMKPGALLINTARGAIINEQDLADALNSGTLAGAGLDVLIDEPPADDNPLLKAANCLITPHISWSSQNARGRLIQKVAENLANFMAGEPTNVVNTPKNAE